MSQKQTGIRVGSVWEGRDIIIKVLHVGLATMEIERLDLPANHRHRLHMWAIESMKGMKEIHNRQ